MPADQLSAAAAVVAYQAVTLTELRGLFDQVDFDFRDALERELRVSDTLDGVESEFDAVRARLRAIGVAAPAQVPRPDAVAAVSGATPSYPRFAVPIVAAEGGFEQLVTLAEARLDLLGIDLSRDPLLQVLPSSQIARSLRSYANEHGDISWDQTDWIVVISAGVLATLLDVILVRIPQNSAFLGKEYVGSPLTRWLQERDRAKEIHNQFSRDSKSWPKCPMTLPPRRPPVAWSAA